MVSYGSDDGDDQFFRPVAKAGGNFCYIRGLPELDDEFNLLYLPQLVVTPPGAAQLIRRVMPVKQYRWHSHSVKVLK